MSQNLTTAETAILDWQFRRAGNFKTHLMEAIAHADEDNLARLRSGFPEEVRGYERFSREHGWWQNLIQKAIEIGYLRPGAE